MDVSYEDIDSPEPATKGDVEHLRENLHRDITQLEDRVKTEFREEMQALVERILAELASGEERHAQRLDEWGRQLFEKIDVVVESRQIDLGAAKTEHVQLNAERLDRHEGRITTLERRGGIPTDR